MAKPRLAYRGTVTSVSADGKTATFGPDDWQVVNPHHEDDIHTMQATTVSLDALVAGHKPVKWKVGKAYNFDFDLDHKYTVVPVSQRRSKKAA